MTIRQTRHFDNAFYPTNCNIYVQAEAEAEQEVKEQSTGNKESEIYRRKQRVSNLYRIGYNQREIAKKLDVSLKTISRDFIELKKEAVQWMEALTEGEIQLVHKRNLEISETTYQELFKLYQKTNDDNFKLKILKQIAVNSKMQDDKMNARNILKSRAAIRGELIGNAFRPKPMMRFNHLS